MDGILPSRPHNEATNPKTPTPKLQDPTRSQRSPQEPTTKLQQNSELCVLNVNIPIYYL